MSGGEATLLAGWLVQLAQGLAILIIGSGIVQNALFTLQLVLAYRALRAAPPIERSDWLWARYQEVSLPISLLAPAYNEDATIVESVRSLLALRYPSFEVIVINDGSRDRTLEVMTEAFGLHPIACSYEDAVEHRPIRGLYGSPRYPNLLLVDKENGGKSDALNAGISVCRTPLFCAMDADSLLEGDALLRAAEPFIRDPARVVAVGGTVRVANGCTVRDGRVVEIGLPRNLLALFQTVEYLRAYLMARLAFSRMRALTLISGAFGLFRRSVAVEVGGYSHGTVGEDLELVVKIHRRMLDKGQDYRIEFLPQPVCWTEVPTRWAVLARQRQRWQRGALETFFKHRDMLFRRRYGRVGSIGFGQMLIVDVIGPIAELLGYLLIPAFWLLGGLGTDYLLAFLALAFVYGVFLSVGALILEEMELRRFPRARDLLLLLVVAVVENFGYRQTNNIWRMVGTWQYLRGTQGWGRMERTGFKRG